jgi:hypothetical protein
MEPEDSKLPEENKYAVLSKDCFGWEVDGFDIPISKFSFFKGEVYKIEDYYVYFDPEDELYWNTLQPIIKLDFEDIPGFYLYYRLPPDSYSTVRMLPNEVFDTHYFMEVDLVERQESFENLKSKKLKEATKIQNFYLHFTERLRRIRPKNKIWPNTYEYKKRLR